MNLSALLLLALLGAATPLNAATGIPTGEITAYTVRRGDTLDQLGTRYLVRPQDYRSVQRLNHISDPRRLRTGSTLRIPAFLLRTEAIEARVEAFSGQVSTGTGATARPVTTATRIAAGTTITTAANAFVTLVFADETRMTLPSLSVVRLTTCRRTLLTGAVDRRISVDAGRSQYSVTPRTNPKDRFEVRTPLAIAAVRGTEFRVGYDAGTARSTLEVLEGEVAGSSAAAPATVAVAANRAALFGADVAPRMLTLPPAPVLVRPGRLQDEAEVAFEFDAAGTHRLQLARDAGFTDLFAEAQSADRAVGFAEVANGTLFVRATTIDDNGIEGVPIVYGFERQRNSVEAGVAPPPPGLHHRYVFRWRGEGDGVRSYRFVLARDAALADRIVDEPGLTGSELALSNLPPGSYYWRLEVSQFLGGKLYAKALKINELHIASEN